VRTPYLRQSFAAWLLGSALVFPLILGVAAAAPAPLITVPQVDTPTRVLFVGNSYLYYGDSVHNHVRRMLTTADPGIDKKLKFKSATIGGSALAHHNIDHLTRPGQIGVKEPFQLVILQAGYASVYGKTSVGNAYDYYGKIDKETAGFLQQVAADTVKKFFGTQTHRD